MASDDLLEGSVPENEKGSTDLALKEHQQFYGLRQSVFSSALAFVAVLYMAAIVIAIILVCNMIDKDKSNLHWHASILVAAFVIPPTVILVALMKGVFKGKDAEKDDSSGMPLADLSKEIWKRGLDAITKADKSP